MIKEAQLEATSGSNSRAQMPVDTTRTLCGVSGGEAPNQSLDHVSDLFRRNTKALFFLGAFSSSTAQVELFIPHRALCPSR